MIIIISIIVVWIVWYCHIVHTISSNNRVIRVKDIGINKQIIVGVYMLVWLVESGFATIYTFSAVQGPFIKNKYCCMFGLDILSIIMMFGYILLLMSFTIKKREGKT